MPPKGRKAMVKVNGEVSVEPQVNLNLLCNNKSPKKLVGLKSAEMQTVVGTVTNGGINLEKAAVTNTLTRRGRKKLDKNLNPEILENGNGEENLELLKSKESPKKSIQTNKQTKLQTENKVSENCEIKKDNYKSEVLENPSNGIKPTEKGKRGRKKVTVNSSKANLMETQSSETALNDVTKQIEIVKESPPAKQGRKKVNAPDQGLIVTDGGTSETDLGNNKSDERNEKPLLTKQGRKKAEVKKDVQVQDQESTEDKLTEKSVGTAQETLKDSKLVDKQGPTKRGRKKASGAEQYLAENPPTENGARNADEKISETVKLFPIKRGRDISKNDENIKKAPLSKGGRKKAKTEQSVSNNEQKSTVGENPKSSIGNTKVKAVEEYQKEEESVQPSKVSRKRKLKSDPEEKSDFSGKQLKIVLERSSSIEDMVKASSTEIGNLSADDVKTKKAIGSSKTKGKRTNDNRGENSKPAKIPKENTSKSKKEQIPDVTLLDFNNKSATSDGRQWNLKIASWNINGVRAWLEKNGLSYLHHEKPDILCLQETKCSEDKLPEELNVEGYYCHWLAGEKDGYSGVGIISKEKPISITEGIGIAEHDSEGRTITAEYEKFYLVTSYVPNAGRGLVRLDYRMQWDKDFRAYLKKLDEKKPVVLCGDLNVAHKEVDIANPKTNKKSAGFTKEERDGFSTLLSEGFIDSFRHLYPDTKDAYTFWTYMSNARAKNVGWRLDYFVISNRLTDNLCDSVIRKDVFGSDHCPIALLLNV